MTDRRRRRRRRSPGLVIAALLSCAGALAGAWPVAAAAPDPAANLQMGPLPLPCYGRPVSAACEVPVVGDLDAARQALGLGPYVLPPDFAVLPPERQLFILVDLDRKAYSLPLISGLSPQLDAAAGAGAASNEDPTAPSSDRAVWASAWAAGLVNVLVAYYQWMYSDGFPGLNIDCPSPAATGCWVHRHGVLFAFGPSVSLTMGAAIATDRAGRPAVGMLIAATPKSTGPGEDYTWADAEADGAGRGLAAATKAGPHRAGRLAAPRITSVRVIPGARTAGVDFTGGKGAHFSCALVPELNPDHLARRYSSCRSPARYSGLRAGAYDFFVRAVPSAAGRSASARARFVIS